MTFPIKTWFKNLILGYDFQMYYISQPLEGLLILYKRPRIWDFLFYLADTVMEEIHRLQFNSFKALSYYHSSQIQSRCANYNFIHILSVHCQSYVNPLKIHSNTLLQHLALQVQMQGAVKGSSSPCEGPYSLQGAITINRNWRSSSHRGYSPSSP